MATVYSKIVIPLLLFSCLLLFPLCVVFMLGPGFVLYYFATFLDFATALLRKRRMAALF